MRQKEFNIAVVNEFWDSSLEKALFGSEQVSRINPKMVNWLDVLVLAGVFTSKSQARKAGHTPDFPLGFEDGWHGRMKVRITTWCPLPDLTTEIN